MNLYEVKKIVSDHKQKKIFRSEARGNKIEVYFDECCHSSLKTEYFWDSYNETICPQCAKNKELIEKYGQINFRTSPIYKRELEQKQIKKYGSIENLKQARKAKTIETAIKKYGSYENFKKYVYEQTKKGHLLKYGVENPFQRPETIKKIGLKLSESMPKRIQKIQETCLKKYGSISPFGNKQIQEKTKQTCLQRYGVSNGAKVESVKQRFSSTRKNNYFKKAILPLLEKNNIIFLDDYKGLRQEIESMSGTKYKLKCTICNNEFFDSLNQDFENICPFCHKHEYRNGVPFGSSKPQEEIFQFLNNIDPLIIKNDRTVIKPKEIDILSESTGIGIEVDGHYWHDTNNSLEKYNLCKLKNIRLIRIFDFEWDNKQSKIKSFLKSVFNHYDVKLFARKLNIKEISNDEYILFCNENHIQNSAKSSIRIGLFDNNELVQIMSFARSRFDRSIQYEMIRECTKLNYQIIGGKSKLFRYFIKKYNPSSIVSYCDKRFFSGNSYYKLGFQLRSETSPSYYYVKHGIVYTRFDAQKKKLQKILNKFDVNLSEKDNMIQNNFKQVFDCGQFKFVWRVA